MKKLFKYLKPYISLILIIIVAIYIQVVYSELALPDYMSKIINNGVIKGDTAYILQMGFKMILISLLGMIMSVIVTYLASKVGVAFARDLRRGIFSKVTYLDYSGIKKYGVSSLITRTTNDITQVQTSLTLLLRLAMMAPIMGIGGIMKILASNANMTWIVGLGVILLIVLVIAVMGFAIPKFDIIQKLTDKLNLVTRENLTGMLVIRSFNKGEKENERFDQVNKDITKNTLFVNKIINIMNPGMTLILNGVILLIIWVGSININLGSLEIGDMLAYIQYSIQILISFVMISMIFIFIPRASASIKRILEILNEENNVKDNKKDEKNVIKNSTVQFKNVSFKYDDAKEDILKDINFTANKGEITAFIGSTGSGKSTLINLVPRFYDVSSGQILIDGIDIRDISLKDLRKNIGYIPQKGLLFSGTIETNIKYGNKNLSDEEMNEVADTSCIKEFIISKDEKYKSIIAQSGSNVSGGQRQRLAIARALATKAKIYIFDDSFSALDFSTEAKIRKLLSKNLKDKTILIVAQRVSTIMHADKIIVLDKGKIVGIGKHNQLMKNCDIYKEIALSQLSLEEVQYE